MRQSSKKPRIIDEETLRLIYGENFNGEFSPQKNAVVKSLRLLDEQQFLSRYTWYGLPPEIPPELLERILYYRGTGVLFYSEPEDKFFFLPYCPSKEIDVYGRWTHCQVLPFTGSAKIDDEGNYLPYEPFKMQHDFRYEGMTYDDYTSTAIPLYDYSRQLSQKIIPRKDIQEDIIQLEANCIPYANTAMMNSTGIQGMMVENSDDEDSVNVASAKVQESALNGKKWIALTKKLNMQDLTPGSVAKVQDFYLAMEALDAFRMENMGLGDGNLFEKKEHMLQSEVMMNAGNSSPILNDGLKQRQDFCNRANSVFGTTMWCELSETSAGDLNMDGMIANEQDQSGLLADAPEQEVQADD